MSNPLIDKFYELFPERKENPKSQKDESSKELIHEFESSSFQVELKDPLSPGVNTKYIQAKNSKVSIKLPELPYASSDPYWKEDTLFQIVEKVKTRDAMVMNVTMDRHNVGPFATGMTTVILEIRVWDTP